MFKRMLSRGSSSRSSEETSQQTPEYNIPREAEVRVCEWPCETFMNAAGFYHEFLQLVENAGLTTFLADKCNQYHLLTNTFVQSFRLTRESDGYKVSFHLYDRPFNITLVDFCNICMIPTDGDMVEPRPRDFEEFLQEVTVGETRGVSHARVASLHFPALRYFGLFIGKCITARQEGGTLSAPDLSILKSAIYGVRFNNLGLIIARRLHTNRSKGIIYGGIYATRLATHFEIPIRHLVDYVLPNAFLDYHSMRRHDFLDPQAPVGAYCYNLVFSQGTRKIITLPAPTLFDVNARGRYIIMPEDITAYEAAQAAAVEIQPWDARFQPPTQFLPGPDGFYDWE